MNRFFDDKLAAVSVEFALVAPIFIFLLCVSLESARIQVARLLVQRSMYDLAYQAKTDPLRLHNFKTISENIINIRNNNIFLANEITIEVFSEPYFANILQTMNPSAGESRDIVRLKFTTDFGILRNLVKTPQSQKQVFVYYYINELS